MLLRPFSLVNQLPMRVVFGSGNCGQLPQLLRELEARRILVVTDRGMANTGIPKMLIGLLASESLDVDCFSDMTGEPTSLDVHRAVSAFRSATYDTVIGVGGGSSLDTAKVVAVLGSTGLPLSAIYGNGRAGTRKIRLVLVPTTAGTGSEATPNALFIDHESNAKHAVVDRCLLPDLALLDPELTLGLPPEVTAFTGMDALAHCIESWISVNANAISQAYSREGTRLIYRNLGTVVVDGTSIEARGSMMMGSLLGGMALTIAGTTAVHALSYPMGTRGVPHGIANGMILPKVLRFNLESCEHQLSEAACAMGLESHSGEAVADAIEQLLESLPMRKTLREVGIGQDQIPLMASEAITQERLLKNNPRHVSQADAELIYESCL